MRKYCVQLKLLIWKNCLLRRRNKLRGAVEVIWPVLVFLVLVALHALGDRANIPNCYFLPKAMPSAGGMAFLQSFLCTFGNNCNDEKNTTNPFQGSLISNFISYLENESKTNQSDKPEAENSSIHKAPSNLSPSDTWVSSLYSSMISQTKEEYENGVKDKNDIFTKINNLLKQASDGENINVTKYFPYIEKGFCGPNVLSLDKQYKELTASGSKMGKASITYEPPEWQNDTGEYCNKLMIKLESEKTSRIAFRMLKPFVRGKIVYSPDAPVVNKIMDELKESLLTINKVTEEARKKLAPLMKLMGSVPNTSGPKVKNNYFNDTSKNTTRFEKMKISTNPNKSTKQLKELLLNVNKSLEFFDCFDSHRTIAMPDEDSALNESMKWLKNERLFALIIFDNVSNGATELPPSLTYKIRTSPDRTTDTSNIHDRVYRPRVKKHPIEDMKYITGGFAYLQNIIEASLIRHYTGNEILPGIYMQQMPYPCHVSDTFRDAIAKTLPMFMIISWVFLFIMLIKSIVTEKENQMKESMRILGVRNSQHWIAWFLDGFIPMWLISLILSVILVKGDVTPKSSIVAVWIFLTAFTIPTIMFAFLLSTLFYRASYGTAVSAFVFFITYLPYPPIAMHEEGFTHDIKLFLAILSNLGFGLGCTWIANMEELGFGAQLNNFDFSPVPGNPVTLSIVMQIFLLDALLYLLIAVYIENVFPGGKNVGLPFYYFLTRTYWRGYNYNLKRASTKSSSHILDNQKDPNRFEPEPEGLNIGVSIQNLTKEFGRGKKKKRAVNDLSINFYENQITSFLGHNGAGKTTSVSMMTGMLPITSGKVFMYGRDIEKDFEVLRHDIAFCKQENVLLNDLNVEEHLYLFSRLRNRSAKEAKNDTKELINDLTLTAKAKTPVGNLSGGMKRKLNIGMAFIGGPKIVFLDEPTAGVDPFARRGIWDLLVKYKSGRTIILTTHFLDEADLLGDRIAIISSGQLQCCGSSLFLKSKLGRGYFLTVESSSRTGKKGRTFFTDSNEGIMSDQAKQIFELIKKTVPEVTFLEEVGTEMTYILPAQSDVNSFEKLFKSFEDNKGKLNFSSYGITHTSLDEIFIKVIEDAESNSMQKGQESVQNKVNETDGEISKVANMKKETRITGDDADKLEKKTLSRSSKDVLKLALRKNRALIYSCQFFALFYVRIITHFRNYKLLCVEIALPMVFMVIALLLGKILPSMKKLPPLPIDISAYEPSMIFYTILNSSDPQILAYEKALLGPYGLGTKCVLSPEKCTLDSIPKGRLQTELKNITDKCSCNDQNFFCPADVRSINPSNAKMSSGDTLYNLTNQDLNSWLISKEIALSKYRYGGVTLGVNTPFTGLTVLSFLEILSLDKTLKTIVSKIPDLIGQGEDNIPSNISDIILEIVKNNINKEAAKTFFKDRNLSNNINVWYNNRGLISVVAFLNGVSNLVLRALLPEEKDPSKYSIKLINYPLPGTKRQLEDQLEIQMNASLLSALSVIWALSIIPATLSLYLVNDRCSGFKHLQIVNGVSKLMYWITAFLWDYFIYSINIAIIIGLYILLEEEAYVGEKSLIVFIVLLIAYGFVSVCFVYPVTFFFEVPSNCFIFITCFNIFVGLVTLLTNFALNLLTDYDDPYYIYSIFTIFHQFCFGKSLMNMAMEHVETQALKNFGMESDRDYFEWHFTLKYIVAMISQGCFYIIAMIVIQYRVFNLIIDSSSGKKLKKMEADKNFRGTVEEDDVKKERDRVESGKAKEDGDAVIINNLSKIYYKSLDPAVNHLTLGIKRGECFGLLGLNGAGKTTTFKMLTGYISPSGGDAFIDNYSIKNDKRQAKLLLGYCPQFDALSSYMTAEEHLSFFCYVRGITGSLRKEIVDENISRLELTKHKNKIVKSLSGGNKRKVNTAIALLGDPTVVLLDEPTSGMDVRARRFLWNCILDVVQEGRCVILTTHSMEECQALCTQISIMVDGKLTCFGSCTHLKQKYNEGYSVLVRCFQPSDNDKVKDHIEKSLPKSTLLQVHYLQMKFKLAPETSVGLAFKILNQAKVNKLIQDYSISQTTLESIFLNFAKANAVKQVTSSTTCMKCWYTCQRKFRPAPMI